MCEQNKRRAMTGGSITHWIGGLKEGEAAAAQKLWERYAQQVLNLARQRLGQAPRTVADEEDIAQSVFDSICRGAAAGRFLDVKTRDALWWLLLTITRQKAVDHVRRETAQKRGGGRVVNECGLGRAGGSSVCLALDQLVSDEPTPEFLVMLDE